MKTIILAYILRRTINDKITDTDHYEVFCEYDEGEKTTTEQAEQRLDELEQHFWEGDTELYSWNIAEVIKTSEHYNI